MKNAIYLRLLVVLFAVAILFLSVFSVVFLVVGLISPNAAKTIWFAVLDKLDNV